MALFRLLKSGETDIESTDIWRFSLHTRYPTYKIIDQGTVTLTANTVGGDLGYYAEEVISHNLTFKPQSFVFADFSAYPPYLGGTQIKVTDVTGWYQFYYDDSVMTVVQYIDENNLTLRIETPESGKTLTFGYMITLDEWPS